MKTVMSLFAHPDDELSAFGTLANHAHAGDRVVLAWMCEGEMTTAIKGTPEEKKEIRRAHMKKIADLIGAEFRVLDFADAHIFPSQESALRVAELIRETKPSILITWNMFWSTGAGHPDHRYTSGHCIGRRDLCQIPTAQLTRHAPQGLCEHLPFPGETLRHAHAVHRRFRPGGTNKKVCGNLYWHVRMVRCPHMEDERMSAKW